MRYLANLQIRGIRPLLASLIVLATGCDLLTGPDTTPASIEVSPENLQFDAVGATASPTVRVQNRDGELLDAVVD